MTHLIALVALVITLVGAWLLFHKPMRWVVYYGQALPAEQFEPYHVIVFDRDGHPPLESLLGKRRKLLGYISLGEAEVNRSDYAHVQKLDVILPEIEGWQGANALIDVRKPAWRKYIVEVVIPRVLEQGFNGIMLDTTDSSLWLEQEHPNDYPGMKQAVADVIHSIRRRYPALHIMLNRGFDVIPLVAADVNMLLAESTYTNWNLQTGQPAMADEATQRIYRERLVKAKRAGIDVFSLDYWVPEDTQKVISIYHHQRRQGYIPYVSTPDLQSIHPEP